MKRNVLISLAVGAVTASALTAIHTIAGNAAPPASEARAEQLRHACAQSDDCDVDIFILSPTEGFYCCNTHGLVSLYTERAEVAALEHEFRNLGREAR